MLSHAHVVHLLRAWILKILDLCVLALQLSLNLQHLATFKGENLRIGRFGADMFECCEIRLACLQRAVGSSSNLGLKAT